MSEISYRVLSHAYESKYKAKTYDPVRRQQTYMKTKPIIGRKARTQNPYGNYKNPYYDPVKRKEYYEAHKDHVTRPYGTGKSGKSGGSSRSGRGSGKARGSSGSRAGLTDAIAKLRDESALNTEAQREATRRKIDDLRKELKQHIETLSSKKEGDNVNSAEIRGKVQAIKKQIESAGGNLQDWISKERDALEKRIQSAYAAKGIKYKAKTQADKKNASKKRNKEVNSRADSIYKSKYGK